MWVNRYFTFASLSFYNTALSLFARTRCITQAALWTLPDLEGRRRGGYMSNTSIVEASAESKKGNDRRAVCILCSNEKPITLSK
jgi:hypothetical protein